jgi:aspartate-semialdehyde dehydrogenase
MSYVVSISDPEHVLSREVLQLIEHQEPSWLRELRLLGEAGTSDVFFRGEPVTVRAANADNRQGVEIAINGNADDVSAGAVVIRLADTVGDAVIVHPDVNGEVINDHGGTLHIPDATGSTIAIIGNALGERIEHITGTLLVPASTLGPLGIEELYGQTVALFNQEHIPTETIGNRLAYNLLPTTTDLTGLDCLLTCPVSLFTVTVPVFGGTMLLLDYWLENELDTADVTQRLATSPVIRFDNNVQPALIVGNDEIRLLPPVAKGNNVRIVAVIDEIRRNAAALMSVVQTVCDLEAF